MADLLFRKTGFPAENSLVICTVTKIYPNSVFVNMDDYGMGGMIHISEVSPGRIRNIREYIKEGKVVICKVLKINRERGHVDLSLRRVTESERKNIINTRKQEQKAERIVENVAGKLKTTKDALYTAFGKKLMEKYGTLHNAFEAVVFEGLDLTTEGIEKKTAELLTEEIRNRIKPERVTIGGEFMLSSYQPDGVDIIQDALITSTKGEKECTLLYLGAGRYQIEISADDYKDAEDELERITKSISSIMKQNQSFAEFHRVDKSKKKTE